MKRRNAAFVIVLAASLAACAPSENEEAPAAEAGGAATIAPFSGGENVFPFTIGSLQAAALKDATFRPANDNGTLAVGRTKAEVDALLTAAGLPTDVLELSVQPLIVRTPDRVLLFDTGNGPSAGTLSASLATAGVQPSAVTDIFISHSHGDHVGGLVDANGALAFPNATVHISENEWAAMQGNDQLAALVATVTPRVSTFAAGADLLPGTVRAVDIQGHTPGHSGYMITSGDASLLYIGDTMHHSVISVQRPDWTIAFDANAPVAQESRRSVLSSSAASGQRIYAVHFPFPGLGRFEDRGGTFVWVAE